jgi:peptide/nickel transport system permease protein
VVAPWQKPDLGIEPTGLELDELGDSVSAEPEEATRERRFGYGIAFWLSATWLAIVVLSAIFAPLLPIPSPNELDAFNRLKPVGTAGHLLGTDTLGRDVLSRLIYGGRVSLTVGVVSVVVGLLVGGTIGMLAGYVRSWPERVIMWVMDVLLSFPALVLLIAIVAYVGHSLSTISLVLGFLAIPIYARLARAHTLSIGQRDYILAAHSIGIPGPRIIRREVVPNVVPPLLSYALIAMGVAIVVEGSLSFLGLSVTVPTPSWGGLIAEGQTFLNQAPSLVLIPSAVMCFTVLALNVAGDTMRRRHETGGHA